jgi:hypothetical protein
MAITGTAAHVSPPSNVVIGRANRNALGVGVGRAAAVGAGTGRVPARGNVN